MMDDHNKTKLKIELSLQKSVSENANEYFEKAKKIKKKFSGIKFIIKKTENEIKNLEKDFTIKNEKIKLEKQLKTEPKKWYSNFRWTKTSTGDLFVLGNDATSNEILVKKHTEKK